MLSVRIFAYQSSWQLQASLTSTEQQSASVSGPQLRGRALGAKVSVFVNMIITRVGLLRESLHHLHLAHNMCHTCLISRCILAILEKPLFI